MKIHTYFVNAFTDEGLLGNPAGVCPLESWLPDETLQDLAKTNAVAETAFFIPRQEGGWHLRWFTPELEMDLCGHATLASAHVIARHLGFNGEVIYFETASGPLQVRVEGQRLTMDFPSRPAAPVKLGGVSGSNPELETILQAIGQPPQAAYKARDYLLIYPDETAIRSLAPDEELFCSLDLGTGGVIVTAPGERVDFVSRFFTPQASIFEDPVTGSAHCTLIPYWAERLGKPELKALQVSVRGGRLWCRDAGERVFISGLAETDRELKVSVPNRQ